MDKSRVGWEEERREGPSWGEGWVGRKQREGKARGREGKRSKGRVGKGWRGRGKERRGGKGGRGGCRRRFFIGQSG